MADVGCKNPSSLLGGSGLGSEEMVHGHATADVGVLIPFHGALGECLLGFGDFLEQGVFRRFLFKDRVPQLELRLQNGIRVCRYGLESD